MYSIWCIILQIFLALGSVLFFVYLHFKLTYQYWRKRGVPYVEPTFPFGNLTDPILGRKSLVDLTIEQYKQFKNESFFGIFNFKTPVLVLRDPALIEQVLVTDFNNFCDKGNASNNQDLLSFYLGNLQGDVWRQLRQKMNGAFSHGKLKKMTEQITRCGDSFVEMIREYKSKPGTAMVDCLGFTFSQRVIASCAFGIEYDGAGMNTFLENIKKMLFGMKVVHLIILWYTYVPKYASLLYYIPAVAKVADYFKNITLATIQVRQNSQTKRNDFLQILLDLKEEEATEIENHYHTSMRDEVNDSQTSNTGRKESRKLSTSEKQQLLTNRCIISQLFIFMSLGMEISSVTISFLLYNLASNLEIQQKVQQEVDDAVKKFGGLSYEALQQLHYLDCVIQENLRLCASTTNITRICKSAYRFPGSDLELEPGTIVMIPSCAIHLDPVNYPEPEVFDPERFHGNHYKPSPIYLPLGMGPRMCIAFNLVTLQLKVAIAKVMQNFTISFNMNTQLPVRYAPQFMPKLINSILIDIESRS